MRRCSDRSIAGHQRAQFHRTPAQSVKGSEALKKPLAGANGSEPSGASQAVTGRDVTALDGLGWVAAAAMQPRTHMAGEWDYGGYRVHIRLVMISNNRRRRDLRTCYGLEFAKSCGARALFWYVITFLVIKIITCLGRIDGHLE